MGSLIFPCILIIIFAVLFWALVIKDSRTMPKLFRVLSIVCFIAFVFGWGGAFLLVILRNLGYDGSYLESILIGAVPAILVGNFGFIGLIYYKHRFITVTQFDKIKLGMSYDEVVSLIGTPRSSSSADGITTHIWKYSGAKRSATYRTVFFQDDKVISKLKGAYREAGLGRIILVLILLPIALIIIGAIVGDFFDVFQAASAVSLFIAIVLMVFVIIKSFVMGKRLSTGLKKVALGMSYDEIISLLGRPLDSAIYDNIVTCVWNVGVYGNIYIVRAIVFKDDKAISILKPD